MGASLVLHSCEGFEVLMMRDVSWDAPRTWSNSDCLKPMILAPLNLIACVAIGVC